MGPVFFLVFFVSDPPSPPHTDLCACHPVPCSCGMVHSGSESASWQVCMNLRLLHNCFVYSQPCDFSSRLSWIAICGRLPANLSSIITQCFHHTLLKSFFFISSIHVKHCENFIFTFWWNVWLFPLKNQFYPLCCWTGYKAKALFLKLTVCLNYELIINNLLNIFPHVFYQKTVLTTDIVYVW